MIEEIKLHEQERRQALRDGRAPPPAPEDQQEGYLAYMSRQVQERTERLGLAGDTMDRLEENSSNFASDVSKYVQSQKRKAVFGGKSLVPVYVDTTSLSEAISHIWTAESPSRLFSPLALLD